MSRPLKNLEQISQDNPLLCRYEHLDWKGPDHTNVEFWCMVVFQNSKQLGEFLKGIPKEVNVLHNAYIDGQELAESLGIPITKNKKKPVETRLKARMKKLAKSGKRD